MQFSRMTQAIRSVLLMLGNFRQKACIPSNILRAVGIVAGHQAIAIIP